MIDTPSYARAAVAAPSRHASEAGRAILADGGDAIEAMIGMAATIAVVYPHMNSVGGDGFWLIHEPGGKLHAVEACGFAGAKATRERYRSLELDRIPARGPHAAVTVAGAVGGWALAREISASRGGKLPLSVLLENAIGHARSGYGVSASEAREPGKEQAALKAAPGFMTTFYLDGERAKEGDRRRMPVLADTLAQLAHAGLDDFYRGDVAQTIASDLERIDAPVTLADLEKYRAVRREPLTLKIEGATLANHPPPTQGLAALIILGLYERLGVARAGSYEHLHGLIEATKRAFVVRDNFVTDFAQLAHPSDRYLEAGFLDAQAARISMARAAPYPSTEGLGDTVWMGAIDASGLAVSYIQSIYWEYGSGCVLPRTGIHWQNRGQSFSLDENALNSLEPGRRPFHTLNPAMAICDDGRVVVYGAMGGDGQPQFQAQIFTRWFKHGERVSAAIDAPRFLLGRTWGSQTTSLKVEDRVDESVLRRLRSAGHDVELKGAYDDELGHAGMIVRHPGGRVDADHDPRSDGGSAGL